MEKRGEGTMLLEFLEQETYIQPFCCVFSMGKFDGYLVDEEAHSRTALWIGLYSDLLTERPVF